MQLIVTEPNLEKIEDREHVREETGEASRANDKAQTSFITVNLIMSFPVRPSVEYQYDMSSTEWVNSSILFGQYAMRGRDAKNNYCRPSLLIRRWMFSVLVKRSHGLTQPGKDDETLVCRTCRREVRVEIPRRRSGVLAQSAHSLMHLAIESPNGHRWFSLKDHCALCDQKKCIMKKEPRLNSMTAIITSLVHDDLQWPRESRLLRRWEDEKTRWACTDLSPRNS